MEMLNLIMLILPNVGMLVNRQNKLVANFSRNTIMIVPVLSLKTKILFITGLEENLGPLVRLLIPRNHVIKVQRLEISREKDIPTN